ncbi:hypothetical protein N2152v2_006862 [Parachlorella kessleri]
MAARPHQSMDDGGTETSMAQPTAEAGAESDLEQLLQYMAVQALNRVEAGQGPQGHMTVTAGQTLVDSYIVNALTLERYLHHDEVAELFAVLLRPGEVESSLTAVGSPAGAAAPEETPFSKRAAAHIQDPELRAQVEALLEEFADRFQRPMKLPSDHDGNMLVAPEDVYKTAFSTPFGLFDWLVLPFGLTGAPASFSRWVSGKVFPALEEGERNPFLTYLDDLLCHSPDAETHLLDLRRALEKARANDVFFKAKKCELMRDELTFLGHRVSKDGIQCEVDKLAAIKEYPAPRNLAELRTLLGLCGFYAKFVPRFADIAAPLTAMQREDVPYVWGPEQEAAFEHLKQAFISPPCLHVADPCRPFIVHVDASGFALGAALMQDFGRGLQPVAYCSRKLKDAEQRYAPHDREMLAVVSALEHWQHYLRGAAKVTVCSDHFSLQHFFSQPSLNQRQLRWKDFLDSLNMEIKLMLLTLFASA